MEENYVIKLGDPFITEDCTKVSLYIKTPTETMGLTINIDTLVDYIKKGYNAPIDKPVLIETDIRKLAPYYSFERLPNGTKVQLQNNDVELREYIYNNPQMTHEEIVYYYSEHFRVTK